jgi:phospholipid/cholesterol/gamma-HCH transport system substrate-binding protein
VRLETRVGLFVVSALGIFIYLSINIRAFRFDKGNYNEYKAYFDDTGGINPKSPVRIAGVEVGWVEAVRLLQRGKAELVLRVDERNKLAKNAYAMINQEGLIGNKTVEIDPGDPTTGFLIPGSTLSMPGKTPTSVGELLDQFRGIALTIQDIASSIKSVVASRKSEKNIKTALTSIAEASNRMSDFSLVLKDFAIKNEKNVSSVINDFKHFSADLKNTMDQNKENINSLLHDLRGSAHELNKGIPKVVNDVGNVSKKIGDVFDSADGAVSHAKGAFKGADEVIDKINTGKGTIGKLVNEEETYTDIKKAVSGFREYVVKTQSLMINVDMHSESFLRNSGATKGYFDLKIRPCSDYFYTLQFVADEFGSIRREVTQFTRRDDKGNILIPSKLNLSSTKKVEFADEVETTIRHKNALLFGLQFGKRFDRLAFRVGLFENAFGVGIDFYVPLKTDYLHWITTLDIFDFRGINRINDSRPHVKWLNRVFFMKNLYTTFGFDDIYSKHKATPFWGTGIRFGDDDLKYFLSSFSGMKR